MPANNRIYWAHQAAGLAPLGSTTYTPIRGLQTCGIDLSFGLEDIIQIGMIDAYEIKEDVPEVSVTLEKILDGHPLIYHLATPGVTNPDFAARQNQRCSLSLSVFGDTNNSASGTPLKELQCSGLYYSSVSYSFPADGNFTESCTLAGNNLAIKTSSFDFTGTLFDNTEVPLATTSGYGGIQRRQNLIWASDETALDDNNQVAATDATILPPDVEGISASGTNDKTNDVYGAHVTNINVSIDVGREGINELGRLGPYFRYATVPAEVTTEIEFISTSVHSIEADENAATNLTNRSIRIKTEEGTFINLGTKNKLTRVSVNGGGTDGSNQTVSLTYRNVNGFSVDHPQMPG